MRRWALWALAAAYLLAACQVAVTNDPTISPSGPATAHPTAPLAPVTDTASGLPFIDPADLPAEAIDTIALIRSGGPFPYPQDGVVFQNREQILPDEPSGYYHEYTVETPGSEDRGARRIVTGREGEMYYTDDHYSSFRRIRP